MYISETCGKKGSNAFRVARAGTSQTCHDQVALHQPTIALGHPQRINNFCLVEPHTRKWKHMSIWIVHLLSSAKCNGRSLSKDALIINKESTGDHRASQGDWWLVVGNGECSFLKYNIKLSFLILDRLKVKKIINVNFCTGWIVLKGFCWKYKLILNLSLQKLSLERWV